MLHSQSPRRTKTLGRRLHCLGFGILTAATLAISAESASAGTNERNALIANLERLFGHDTNLNNATPEQLAAAVEAVLNLRNRNNDAIFRPGIVAGEALKSPAATVFDAGDEIGEAVESALGNNPLTLRQALIDAALTAGRGSGADASEVVGFSQALTPSAETAKLAAIAARGSKAGAAAIIAGYAATLGTDAERAEAVTGAIRDRRLAGAAAEIASAVAETADDTAALVGQLILGTPTQALRLISGVVAADPQNAGAITQQALNTAAGSNNARLTAFIRNSGISLAQALGKTADIEQISLLGNAIADQIGLNRISLTRAATLTNVLAKAIFNKPLGHSAENRADEIGEVAAVVMAQIVGNSALTARNAGSTALAIIRAAATGGRSTRTLALPATYIADIAGSVARTIANSSLSDALKTAIRNYLLDPRNVRKISTTLQVAVANAIQAGFNNDPTFENGNDVGSLFDPETPVQNG